MTQRVITAVVALSVFIPLLLIGGHPFDLMIAIIAVIAFREILQMAHIPFFSWQGIVGVLTMAFQLLPSYYLALFPQDIDFMTLYFAGVAILLMIMVFKPETLNFEKVGIISLAAVYVGRGFHLLIETRILGLLPVLYILLIIWGNDTFAYLVGRRIGRTPLAPKISPNKTIEGSVGGIVGAFVCTSIVLYFSNPFGLSIFDNVVLAIVLGLTGQLGDLVESAIKRHYQVKDSGNIMPGHGGFLDRFDSLLLVLPIFYFLIPFLSN
ncbi:phosphatidate cytidylyltransferase [Aerococcus sp. 1KP-2016]|jgi:phosphatidate cytidylyltransferase|uniref:phosphatidate cytidylyltransferase n=1 Tax=Aerococcus sp. 1KP-2016 TaxID=1981982 RepID=UPI000B9889EE|nr:phosphatidate cytidylyltransferase [Aerococcus sp. 1KP-2016]OYQ68185.1 phosphatidate cytidylyltransferase [Aerococcus sp. 1KP-2016]